jgi:hypothetical protein
MYEIPKVASIPESLYKKLPLENAFRLLGFETNDHFNLERTYSNSLYAFTPTACETPFRWVILISFFSSNSRTIVCPTEFGISNDLTPIEILSILYREWVSGFSSKKSIPDDLIFGQKYLEHIQALKKSRPKPWMSVDRETFRFFISKIKREVDLDFEDKEIEFSCIDGQLRISIDSKAMYVPAISCYNITSERIFLSGRHFCKNIPKRFTGDTLLLGMERKNRLRLGSSIIDANWDGPDLWEYDEYDEFLATRILRRSPMLF